MSVEVSAKVDPASMNFPAHLTNRFQVSSTGETVRIAFAEQQGDAMAYRSVIVMSGADAKELIAVLAKVCELAH